MSQVRKFKLLKSFYFERQKGSKRVKKYTPGQIVESRFNLCEKFRNKFEEVDAGTEADEGEDFTGPINYDERSARSPLEETPTEKRLKEKEKKGKKGKDKDDKDKDAEEEEEVMPEGKDVTDKYELAEKNELTVMKQQDKSYIVYDKESVVVAEAASADELKEFLAGYGKEGKEGKHGKRDRR